MAILYYVFLDLQSFLLSRRKLWDQPWPYTAQLVRQSRTMAPHGQDMTIALTKQRWTMQCLGSFQCACLV